MKTINECLMALKKDEMIETAFRLGLRRLPTNARKAEWAAHIENSMQDEPDRVRLLLTVEDMQELRALLAKGNCINTEEQRDCPWEALHALRACGLASFYQYKWYIQPCVSDMLVMDEEETEQHHIFDVIADLIEGWLIHVGMMPLFRLIDWIVDKMQAPEEDQKDIRRTIVAVMVARRGSGCFFDDEEDRTWIVHEDVEDPDALLCRLQEPHIAALEYPAFTAEELIFSAVYTNLPGSLELYKPLKEWLEAHDADDVQFEDALDDLVFFTQNDDRSEGLNSVINMIPPKDMKDAECCVKAVEKVINRIPLWMNKGHSGEEVYLDVMAKKAAMPGRNDPCPCGSGRKYKHCCGKRVN